MAKYPQLVEHCLAFQADDLQVRQEFNLSEDELGVSPDQKTKFIATTPESTPSAIRNWNAGARISSGIFLLAIADDLVPNYGWDDQLWKVCGSERFEKRLWKITDSRCISRLTLSSSDILPRHPMLTRALYGSYGFIFDPSYVTVGPDDEWLLQGLKRNFIRDARSVQLHHAVGPILDSSGNLLCGCSEARAMREKTESQMIIHSKEWVEVAKSNLRKWGVLWRFIDSLANSGTIANQILAFSAHQKGSQTRALHILLSLYRSRELRIRNKILLTQKLVVFLLRN